MTPSVTAMQWWRHGDHAAVTRIPHCPRCRTRHVTSQDVGVLRTQTGTAIIYPGDWIVTDPNGDLHVLPSDQINTLHDLAMVRP